MTYDATAKLLAVKVIGTVESNLDYSAVNTADPITVGIAQWYGTRAAAILDRMRDENPTAWTGVTASLTQALADHPATDAWWNTCFLDAADAASIAPVLANNAAIQNDQFGTDIDGYAQVARNQGMDVDAHTDSFIFFATMYHQGPKYAFQVMATVGPNATLDAYRNAALNNPVLGQYPARYNTAYTMIISGDTSGVPTTTAPPPPAPTPGGGGGTVGTTRPQGPVSHIELAGNNFIVHGNDGSKTVAVPTSTGRWIAGQNPNAGAPAPATGAPGTGGGGGGGTAQGQALVDFAAAHANAWAYGQGPGRLQPDASGYTDCSGFVYWDYLQTTGMNIGTWGGSQINGGTFVAQGTTTIDTFQLQLGDVIFYMWPGGDPVNYDHTVLYAGNGKCWSHGGPGNGPVLTDVNGGFTITPAAVQARRYLS